jgi:hypothetical protein
MPVKTRTEEPASTTIDGKVNPVDESTEKDVNSDQFSNTQVPPKGSTNQ